MDKVGVNPLTTFDPRYEPLVQIATLEKEEAVVPREEDDQEDRLAHQEDHRTYCLEETIITGIGMTLKEMTRVVI